VKIKTPFIIAISLLITLMLLVYQRATGPSYPVRGSLLLKPSGARVEYRLIRSHETTKPAIITFVAHAQEGTLNPQLHYRPFPPLDDHWETVPMLMEREKNQIRFNSALPQGPAASKWNYFIDMGQPLERKGFSSSHSLVLRYRDPVPTWILLVHIVLIFMSFFFSTTTFLFFMVKRPSAICLHLSFFSFLLGAFIFGPLVQKHAFGSFWTGFPIGTDLTDNKVLISLVAWAAAWFYRERKPKLVVWAWIIMMLVFLIPHSWMGSQYNHKTGKMDHVFSKRMDLVYPRCCLFTSSQGSGSNLFSAG